MMDLPRLFQILGGTLLIVVLIGIGSAGVLRLARRRSIRWHLVIAVAAVGLTITGSVLVATTQMLFAPEDLLVVVAVTTVATSGAFVVAGLVVRRLVADSRHLQNLAAHLADENPPAATAIITNREFTGILTELDRTRASLLQARQRSEDLDQSRRHFLTGISHDLRTPLAAFRAILDGIHDGIIDDPDAYLDRMRSVIGRMEVLVDDLFHLSVIEAGSLSLAAETIDITDLVSDAVADLAPIAGEHSIALDVQQSGGILARVDAHEISRLTANLLSNALTHTPPGTNIRVAVERLLSGEVLLSISDDGPGMSGEEAERAFDVGWRGDTARTGSSTRGSSGAGLGLSIARGIVNAHAGSLTLRTAPGAGARFNAVFPGGSQPAR